MDFDMFEGSTMVRYEKPLQKKGKKNNSRSKDGHKEVVVRRQQAVWWGSKNMGVKISREHPKQCG